MTIPKQFQFSFIIFAACALLAGCINANNKAADHYQETAFVPSANAQPSAQDSVLKISLAVNEAYCLKTACSCIADLSAREYDQLVEVLLTKYNIDLQLTYYIEEYEMVDSLRAKAFDGVICKPWLAFMLVPEYKIDYKRVADLLDPSNNQWLTGHFIVKVESEIKSMEEITGKSLAIGQPDSYEKYHLPMAMLKEGKITPKEFLFKASCLETLNMLHENEVEVAVISDYSLTASCAVDFITPNEFRSIGVTAQMPLCSVILDMAKVSEADALRLQKALLEISGDSAPAGLLSRGFVAPASWIPVPYVTAETK
jgi:ABC-type phosphate/phosphonate transport system substrate-binding protein